MKNALFVLLFLFFSTPGFSQRMNTAQRDAIAGPEHGLMIYNTSANCLQVNTGTSAMPLWNCLSLVTPPPPPPTVTGLSCANATFTPATFTGHITYAGVLSLPLPSVF